MIRRSTTRRRRAATNAFGRLLTYAFALGLASVGSATAGGDHSTPTPATISDAVYNQLNAAQLAAGDGRTDVALEALDDLAGKRLGPYERAQVQNVYGYVHFLRDDLESAVKAYAQILEIRGIPEAIVTGTLYTLAQLDYQQEDYASAAQRLEQWMSAVSEPGPDALALLGQTYFQLGRRDEAAAPVRRAIAISEAVGGAGKESWYQLLRVIYSDLGDTEALLGVLETLVTKFPRKEYWMHLAATYSERGDDARRLAAYELAYEAGYLATEGEIRLLAQLLMQANVPYRAGRVLAEAMDAGSVSDSVENLRLLSQAWTLAREDDLAIDALSRAAKKSDDAELDARLAHSYANLGQWTAAIRAADAGLRKGAVDAHDLHLTKGIALIELSRLDEARAAFQRAMSSPEGRDSAARWVSYIDGEEARRRELDRSLR